jgi:hypothetical protein
MFGLVGNEGNSIAPTKKGAAGVPRTQPRGEKNGKLSFKLVLRFDDYYSVLQTIINVFS